MVSRNQAIAEKIWTFTLMYLCLWWRTDAITECILAERGLSNWGSDVRSMSICAAEWTPNTFCTHSILTFRPIHRNKWMPFSVTKNMLQKLHSFRGCTVTTQFMTLLASLVHLTTMLTLLVMGNYKVQNRGWPLRYNENAKLHPNPTAGWSLTRNRTYNSWWNPTFPKKCNLDREENTQFNMPTNLKVNLS
jgi:hypothetical protein